MAPLTGRVALVTGGSRGVGAATVEALARAGADVVVNCRNKVDRAERVARAARAVGVRALVAPADITDRAQVEGMLARVRAELGRLDVLVLNASGGMERDLVADDPDYPMRVNRDGPLDLVGRARPLMGPGSVVIHVTSHLAYLYGRVEQIPEYEPVAAGVRLAVVSGDLIEDTIVPQLMERRRPGTIEARWRTAGSLLQSAEVAD